MYDVMVVGAGPVGSYLAYRLACQGHEVIVFERRPQVADAVCCTGIIGEECYKRFPFFYDIVLAEASSAKFFSPSGRFLRMSKGATQAYIIDRPAFDRSLARRAQEQGANYLLAARVESIAPEADLVKVDVESQGEIASFAGKMVIVSNGFGFRLPQRLGLGRVKDYVLGAQAEVVGGGEEVELYFGQGIAPGFFAWLVPTFPGKALVGLLSRRRPDLYLGNLLSSLAVQGKIASPEAKTSYGGIPLTPLPKTYGERVIVVGDAAGQVKPTTGGGIYYGLLCADIAADTVHEALTAGDLSAKKLSAYEKDWKKKLARELQIGYYARRLYERLSDRQIEHVFDIVQSNGIHEALLESRDFSFDWHGGLILGAFRDKAMRRVIWAMTRSLFPF